MRAVRPRPFLTPLGSARVAICCTQRPVAARRRTPPRRGSSPLECASCKTQSAYGRDGRIGPAFGTRVDTCPPCAGRSGHRTLLNNAATSVLTAADSRVSRAVSSRSRTNPRSPARASWALLLCGNRILLPCLQRATEARNRPRVNSTSLLISHTFKRGRFRLIYGFGLPGADGRCAPSAPGFFFASPPTR